jgi:hypothetical protein
MADTFSHDEGVSTAAELVRLSLSYNYGPTLPELCELVSSDEVKRTYRANHSGGHYFDADTLRYFGSRSFTVRAPGVTVECQSNAPEGCGRYRVTAWAWEERNGVRELQPFGIARCFDARTAARLARAVPEAWAVHLAAYAAGFTAGHRAGVMVIANSEREAAAMLDGLTAARDALAAAVQVVGGEA